MQPRSCFVRPRSSKEEGESLLSSQTVTQGVLLGTSRLSFVFVPPQQGHIRFQFLRSVNTTVVGGLLELSPPISSLISTYLPWKSQTRVVISYPEAHISWANGKFQLAFRLPLIFFFTCATWLSTNVGRKVHVLYWWWNNRWKIKYENVKNQ